MFLVGNTQPGMAPQVPDRYGWGMSRRIEAREVNRAASAILATAKEDQGISLRTIEDRSGVKHLRVMRALNCEQPMTVDDLEAIASALGLVGWQVMQEAECEVESMRAAGGASPVESASASVTAIHPAPSATELEDELTGMPVNAVEGGTVDKAARHDDQEGR